MPPPTRWFLLLPLLAMAAWWPIEPYWQSDDYIALHYSQDLGRALHDFVGPQFGATDLWFFYRPFITLSFWFDQCLGGAMPPVSHVSNVVAHGASALLTALLWRRFLPDPRAFLAGLLWALMPSHIGSLAWAVGRVDSHTTVWCLLCLWLFVRHDERRRAGEPGSVWPCLLAFAGALCSKELAFVVPPLAALLAFVRAPAQPFARRAAAALRRAMPLFALFAAYLPLRFAALGRFGGYDALAFDLVSMLRGLGHVVADLLVPLRWIGLAAAGNGAGLPRAVWLWSAAVPIFVALVCLLRRPRWSVALVFFLVALLPMAGFLAGADNPHNLRYYYLPTVALAGLLANGGRIVAALVLLAWAGPFLAVRGEQVRADRESAAMHRALLREADEAAAAPMFVAGLPHTNRALTSMQFHFGVDRLLQPPFRSEGVRLFALRPVAEPPGVSLLGEPGQPPESLPYGSTWWFADATALVRTEPRPTLPELVIEGDADGTLDLSSARLRDKLLRGRQTHAMTADLTTRPGRPAWYRLTIFTASGYLAGCFPDHGAAGDDHGTIDVLQFFGGGAAIDGDNEKVPPAQWAPHAYVMTDLALATTHDLELDFPVLLEAGELRGIRFVPSHRARRLLTFRFDRGYAAWTRWALNIE